MSSSHQMTPDPNPPPLGATQTTTLVPDSAEEQRQQTEKNQALIQLLRSWREEDPEEQRETLEFLMRVLDEDRYSTRKLFP